MELLAHRGWWFAPTEKNTRMALERALAAGYGVETDIRDCDGELVIAHDMPRRHADPEMQLTFADFLELYTRFKGRPTLALNIKADGMVAPLRAALSAHGISSYFVFDMSVPDTLAYLSAGIPVYTRRSEFETGSILDEHAPGVWLDAFETPFVPPEMIAERLAADKTVAIVSPELHRKPHLEAWHSWRALYRALPEERRARLQLCTDFPSDAADFFG